MGLSHFLDSRPWKLPQTEAQEPGCSSNHRLKHLHVPLPSQVTLRTMVTDLSQEPESRWEVGAAPGGINLGAHLYFRWGMVVLLVQWPHKTSL